MNDALAERSGSLTDLPVAQVGDRLHRKVRFRRARRHTLEAGGATAAVAVLGTTTWLGLNGTRDEPAPAVSPTASSTPVPSPSLTPTPAPTSTPTPVADDILGLPPTYALPAGLLEQTTPGWVLGIYRSVSTDFLELEPGLDGVPNGAVNTVVLASPTGDLYRVVDLPEDMGVSLLRWEAGATTAVVRIDWDGDLGQGVEPRAVLDLVTGELTPTALGLEGSDLFPNEYVGQAADGVELWTEGASTDSIVSELYRVPGAGSAPQSVGLVGFRWLLDPTGRWLVTNVPSGISAAEPFALVDVVDGGRTEVDYGVPGQSCEVVGWLDPGELLAYCLDAGDPGYEPDEVQDPASLNAAYYRVEVSPAGSTTTLLSRPAAGEPRPWTWEGGWAGPGTLAVVGTLSGVNDPSSCAADAYVWTGTSLRPTGIDPGETMFTFRSGQPLLVASQSGCTEMSTPVELRSYAAASGTTTLLAPAPPPTAEVPEWLSGLESWVPAG
ncbi:hypothetical protein ASF78_07830 [Cellulomonas sp. Leaf334]|nr:hypothetical protein ASF78_07830 [Cellulomonas sp. Leaf334]